MLVLHEESYAQLDRFGEYRESMQSVSPDTLEDFQAKNERPGQLADILDLGVSVRFITGQEYQKPAPIKDGRHDWAPFYAKCPEAAGVIFLSGAGFDGGRTQALVRVGRGCGVGCGEGAFVFLRKVGGTWRVMDSYGGWMS